MTRSANRISAEHLRQRLAVSGSDDELDGAIENDQ
jgi:hypothetical protein